MSEAQKIWRSENKEKIQAYIKEWRKNNHDKILKQQRKRFIEKREFITEVEVRVRREIKKDDTELVKKFFSAMDSQDPNHNTNSWEKELAKVEVRIRGEEREKFIKELEGLEKDFKSKKTQKEIAKIITPWFEKLAKEVKKKTRLETTEKIYENLKLDLKNTKKLYYDEKIHLLEFLKVTSQRFLSESEKANNKNSVMKSIASGYLGYKNSKDCHNKEFGKAGGKK